MELKINNCKSCVYFLKPDTRALMFQSKVNEAFSCKDYNLKDVAEHINAVSE